MNRRWFLKLLAAVPAAMLLPRIKLQAIRKTISKPEQCIEIWAGNKLLLTVCLPLRFDGVAITATRMFWSQDLNRTDTKIVLPDGEQIVSLAVYQRNGPAWRRYSAPDWRETHGRR